MYLFISTITGCTEFAIIYPMEFLMFSHLVIQAFRSTFIYSILKSSQYHLLKCKNTCTISFKILFHRRIVALQYCIALCHTSTWISHKCTHFPSLLKPSPISHATPPPWLSPSTGLSSLCHTSSCHLPDILECKVKWALGSITTNKASGGDGIPVELFQILKDDDVLHSICQQIWKTQKWP